MKKTFNYLLIFVIGFSLFTFQSCKDDDTTTTTPTPTPVTKTCYITQEQQVQAGDTTTTVYTYNATNQLIKITETEDGDVSTITLTYVGTKLAGVTGANEQQYTLKYTGDLLTRIDLNDFGALSYDIITYTNGKATKSEQFKTVDGKSELALRTTISYSGDNVSSFKLQVTDDNGATFEDLAEIKDPTYDSKNDIYNGNLAFRFSADLIIPAISKNNMTKATIISLGDSSTEAYTYTYNDNNYPMTESSTSDGVVTKTTYTYNCP
jgi:hypothetical protein